MSDEVRKYIGQVCYARLLSKAELIRVEDNMSIPLTPSEYKILSFFIDHENSPVYLHELARFVWGIHADEKDPSSLKSQISRVRGKLEKIRLGLGDCINTNYGFNSYTMRVIDNPESKTADSPPKKVNIGVTSANTGTCAFVLTRVRSGEVVMLKEGLTLLGRNRVKCTYCIADNPKISLLHAAIYIKPNGHVAVQDMNSMTGTYLNQRRLPPMVEFTVHVNDHLRLADEDFFLSKEPE